MVAKWGWYNVLTLDTTDMTLDDGYIDAFYPITNIEIDHTYKEIRTSSGTSFRLLFDLQTPTLVNGFFATGNHVSGEFQCDNIVIEGSNTNVWTSPGVTTTVTNIDATENLAFASWADTSFRYWRITFNNPTGSYAGVSNIFLGQLLDFGGFNDITYGWSFERVDNSNRTSGRYKQKYIDRINDYKKISGSIELLNVDEFGDWTQMIDYCGTYRPVWMIVDSSEVIVDNKEQFAGYFYFDSRPASTNVAHGLHNTSFALEEIV